MNTRELINYTVTVEVAYDSTKDGAREHAMNLAKTRLSCDLSRFSLKFDSYSVRLVGVTQVNNDHLLEPRKS